MIDKLGGVLCELQDAFSTTKTDLGSCSLMPFEVKVPPDNAPVTPHPFRINPTLTEKADATAAAAAGPGPAPAPATAPATVTAPAPSASYAPAPAPASSAAATAGTTLLCHATIHTATRCISVEHTWVLLGLKISDLRPMTQSLFTHAEGIRI